MGRDPAPRAKAGSRPAAAGRGIARAAAGAAVTEDRYAPAARLLHWLMAAGFIFMWACGYAMTTWVAEDSALEERLFDLHISIGVTLLGLMLVRGMVRVLNEPPPLPDAIPSLERVGARFGHLALYLLPLLIIAAGWAETNLEGYGVRWFGYELPIVLAEWEPWAETAADLHRWLAYTMLAVTVVHVAAVVKHRRDGHDVLRRML